MRFVFLFVFHSFFNACLLNCFCKMVDFLLISQGLIASYGLLGLFAIAFLSASLLPFPSEPVIILASKLWGFWEIMIVVTVASAFAASINYYVGFKGIRFFLTPRDKDKERRAHNLLEKYGVFALIASPWIPFLGDLFPVVAGFLKMDFYKFLAVIVTARVIKTGALLWFSSAFLHLI